MHIHHCPYIHEQLLLKARFPFYLPWDRDEEEEEEGKGEEKEAEGSSEGSAGSHECLSVARRANRANEVLFLGMYPW